MRRIVAGLSGLVTVLLCLSSVAFAADRVVHVKVRADSEHPGNEAFRAMDGQCYHQNLPHMRYHSGDSTVSECCVTGRTHCLGLSCKPFLGQDLLYG